MERADPLAADRPGTQDATPPQGTLASTIAATGDAIAVDAAKGVVAGLRFGRRNHVLGCPMGCPLSYHEDGCPVGSIIDDSAEYDGHKVGSLGLNCDHSDETCAARRGWAR
jgi:hypothetical protein